MPGATALLLVLVLGAAAAWGKPILPQFVFPPAAAGPSRASELDDPVLGRPHYDSIESPLPTNVPSLGFHISGTDEFGNFVRLAGAAHYVDSVSVTLSSWAIRSDYPTAPSIGFTHPITLRLYAVDRRTGSPRPGALLGSVTRSFLLPWRPEPDAAAPDSPLRPWRGADGNYYGGLAFNVTFDLGPIRTPLPEELIVTVAFNTRNHGEAPLGLDGPYNGLGVGLTTAVPAAGAPGQPGSVYWRTADAERYEDRGAAGTNLLRADAGWGAYQPAIRFNNSAYGTLADVATRLMDWRSADADVARALQEAQKLVAAALDRPLWADNRRVTGAWGGVVFNLLAELAGQLGFIASTRDPAAGDAQWAADALVTVAEFLAENALGDAVIAGGDARRIARAQAALEAAFGAEARIRYDLTIDEFGNAWREARLALR